MSLLVYVEIIEELGKSGCLLEQSDAKVPDMLVLSDIGITQEPSSCIFPHSYYRNTDICTNIGSVWSVYAPRKKSSFELGTVICLEPTMTGRALLTVTCIIVNPAA